MVWKTCLYYLCVNFTLVLMEYTKKMLKCTVILVVLVSCVAQDNSIKEICMVCGDIVNNYCCRYYNSCCECKYTKFRNDESKICGIVDVNPSGCPTPSSPEARKVCSKNPSRCYNNEDCPSFKQCCRTICGSTCINAGFQRYRYVLL